MTPFRRLPQNPTDYQSIPDDPADWTFLMQQWTKERDSTPNNKKPDLPTHPKILEPVKSERFEFPTSPQISNSIKKEILELPTSQSILEPVKLEVLSPFLQNPIKSEVDAPSLGGTDCGETLINVVAGTHCSDTSKEIQSPSRIRKSREKKKYEHKKLEAERLTRPKLDRVFSEDNYRDNTDNSISNCGRLSKRPRESRHPDFNRPNQLIRPPSNMCSSQKYTNGTSLIRKAKDEMMEKSILKAREILTKLLFETTENQVLIIVEEELKRAKSIAQSVGKSFSVLSSLSGKLGLKIYDSDDSDNSERKRNEKNQLESDEELQILIEQRQRNFEKIEMQIDLEIESRKEKENSIAYQNEMRGLVRKNNNQRNKSKLLESTRHAANIRSKITKVVPKSPNLTVDFRKKPKNQQTHCLQKDGVQSMITRNGVIKNLETTESRDNLSSSSSTLSPSSLSSTTSCSSESRSYPRSTYNHSPGWDSDSNRDSRMRCKSKINRTNTRSTRPYSRRNRSPSKEFRTGPSHDYHSPCWRNESSKRHSSLHRIADSSSRFRNRKPLSGNRRRLKSSEREYSKCNRYWRNSSESESSCERTKRW